LVSGVDNAVFKDIGFFDLWNEAGDGGGEFAALEVEASDVEVAGGGVNMRIECISRYDMGGVRAGRC